MKERRLLGGVQVPEKGLDATTLEFVRKVVAHQAGIATLELTASSSRTITLQELAEAEGESLKILADRVMSIDLLPNNCPQDPTICATDTAIRKTLVEEVLDKFDPEVDA